MEDRTPCSSSNFPASPASGGRSSSDGGTHSEKYQNYAAQSEHYASGMEVDNDTADGRMSAGGMSSDGIEKDMENPFCRATAKLTPRRDSCSHPVETPDLQHEERLFCTSSPQRSLQAETVLPSLQNGTITGTVVYLGSNQDQSLVSVGTAEGAFYIFSTASAQCVHQQTDCGGPVVIVEMLLNSSIVAVVVASCIRQYDHIVMSTDNGRRSLGDGEERPVASCEEAVFFGALEETTDLRGRLPSSPLCAFAAEGGASQPHHQRYGRWGCRDIQLWNLRTSSRIAVVSFPTQQSFAESLTLSHLSVDDARRPSGVSAQLAHGDLLSSSEVNQGPVRTPNSTCCCSRDAASAEAPTWEPECKAAHPTIVAVKLTRRRMIVLFDCPSAEIEIFELRSLRLIHRLERNVVVVANVMNSPQALRIANGLGQFRCSAFRGVDPSCSLASVAALSIHPCQGFLAVPVGVPAVDLNAVKPPWCIRLLPNDTVKPQRPVADETLVAAAALKGSYTHNEEVGSVVLVDLHGAVPRRVNSAKVHEHPLAALAFNGASTMLATASVKGTIFRVWAVPSFEQLWCWRRGSRPARVYSLSFTWNSHFMVSVSRTREISFFSFCTGETTRRLSYLHSTLPAAASQSRTDPFLRDETTSVHIFLCTRSLTALQRKKHLPSEVWGASGSDALSLRVALSVPTPPDDHCPAPFGGGAHHVKASPPENATSCGPAIWRPPSSPVSAPSDVRPVGSFTENVKTTGWTRSHVHTVKSDVGYIYGERDVSEEDFELCCPPSLPSTMPGAVSQYHTYPLDSATGPASFLLKSATPPRWPPLPSLLPLRLGFLNAGDPVNVSATWRSWITSTASSHLKNIVAGVVLPNLPDSIKESWIESQKCFAKVLVKNATALMGGNTFRNVCAVAVVLEPPGQRLLEIRVFSDTGCVLNYVCDGKTGGEARLMFEQALLYPV